MELAQLFRVHRRRRPRHQIDGIGRLRERDDLANRRFAGEDRDDTVQPERNASVRVMACSGATGALDTLLTRATDCQIGQNIETGTLSVASPTFTPASSRSRSGVISRCRSAGSRRCNR